MEGDCAPPIDKMMLRAVQRAPPGFYFLAEAVSAAEHDALVAEASEKLSRLQVTPDHFDHVISRYRESIAPAKDWNAANRDTLSRLRAIVERDCGHAISRKPVEWMEPHIIELEADKGAIGPHVDSVKHGGDVVAALSLLSTRQVTLDSLPDAFAIDLPPRSLYVLSGHARYELKHAISNGPARRLSLVLRDEPQPPPWMLAARAKLQQSRRAV